MKRKRIILQISAFILAIAPLAVYLGVNYQYYFLSAEKSYGVGVFVAMLIVLYALKDNFSAMFKNHSQMKISLFLLVVFWVVAKMSDEVILLSFLSFVGSVIALPLGIWAKKVGVKIAEERQSEITKSAISQVISISKK